MADVIEVTEVELSEYLGLSTRRIRQLFKEGVVIKSQRGRYDLKKSVLGYINSVRQQEKRLDDNLEKLKISKEATSLQHEQLKKRKTELQVQELEKKLHRSEDVEYFWNAMVLAAKSRLTSIPVKCAPILVGIEDRKEIQSILKREVAEALNEIADYDVEKFDANFGEEDGWDDTE
jgi:phage terminase Nu1 subunit (DNA packaging protein)